MYSVCVIAVAVSGVIAPIGSFMSVAVDILE